MKKLLIILLQLNLFLSLYAQEKIPWEHEIPWEDESGEQAAAPEEEEEEEEKKEEASSFLRQFFEIGIDVGAGLDNDLVGIGEILKKNIRFNMKKLGNESIADGFNLNLGLLGGLFINIKDLKIAGGIWNIGVSGGADGGIHSNIPESLLLLLSKGNYQRTFGGMISASGGIFADIVLSLSAKYNKLRIGVKPGVFTPVVFIPKSGINYTLETTDDKLELLTSGNIIIYSPVIDVINDRGLDLAWGSDISLEGEYDLLSFLGLGVSVSNIPVTSAMMEKRTMVAMKDYNITIEGEKLLNSKEGEEIKIPDFKYEIDYDIAAIKAYRPLRFDIYALYRPFGDLLLVKPNIGFTLDINDAERFFNAGAECQVNLFKNLLAIRFASGYYETIWKHRLGFALNFRAFELDLEGVLRSHSLGGSFLGRGLGLNMGIRFGW